MNKLQALDKATNAVAERGENYGDVRENHQRIAALWSVVLGRTVTPEQVVLCMTCLKVARLVETPDHEDSWVDIAGYGACGAEVATDWTDDG
mgnify:CR=1 FL=1|jgi:hypothetical protein